MAGPSPGLPCVHPIHPNSATMHAAMNAPGPTLNLIVVEDSELDYELLLAMLMREGLRPRAVRARAVTT